MFSCLTPNKNSSHLIVLATAWLLASACKKQRPEAFHDAASVYWHPPALAACSAPCRQLSWPVSIEAAEWVSDSMEATGTVAELSGGTKCQLIAQQRNGKSRIQSTVRVVCPKGVVFMSLHEDLSKGGMHEIWDTRCKTVETKDGDGYRVDLRCRPHGPSTATHTLTTDLDKRTGEIHRGQVPGYKIAFKLGPSAKVKTQLRP